MPQTIAGILGIQDSERTYLEGVGQRAIYDAVQEYLAMVNNDLVTVSNLFIGGTIEDHKFRYYLPGDGELQRMSEMGRPGERKIGGSWDVAFPIEAFGDALGTSRIDFAYMTLADYQRSLDAIVLRAQNTLRREILRALFYNQAWTFSDILRGDLSVQCLANNDGTLYPAVAGGTTAAQAQHYAESGYATASISDLNNPIKTISNALRSRWGAQLNRRRVVLIAEGAQPYVEALTDFEPVDDPFVTKGANADQLNNLPVNIPGEIIGRTNGAFVSVWPWMPANYMIGMDLDADKPLRMRVDPAFTNLPRGLALVAQSDEFPITKSDWQWRFGLGVANRLNGYIMELGTGGSYTVPTGYSR